VDWRYITLCIVVSVVIIIVTVLAAGGFMAIRMLNP
jgi:hypothetical protein